MIMNEITSNNGGSQMEILIQRAEAYVSDLWANYSPEERHSQLSNCLNHYKEHKCIGHGNCHDMHFSILGNIYDHSSLYAADLKATPEAFIVDLYNVNFLVPNVTKMTDDLPEVIPHAWRITIEVLNGKFVWTIDKTHGRYFGKRFVEESELSHILDITFACIDGLRYGFMDDFAYADNQRFALSFRDWLADTIDVSELLPIMRYLGHDFTKGSDRTQVFFHDLIFHGGPFGIPTESARMNEVLKDRKGTKDCLNAIYDPSGLKRLTKNAFGGLGEIRDLDQLLNAVAIIEALSPFEANVFENIDLSRVIDLWSHIYYDTTVRIAMYHKIISFFGVKEKTLFALLRILANVDGYPHTDLVWVYDEIMEIEESLTYGDHHEQDAAVAVIKAAVDRFNADQDFGVVAELISEEIKKMKDTNVPVEGEFYSRVDGHMITPEIKVVSPKITHDLITWGAQQNTCIGNYIYHVRSGSCYIIGFQKPNGKWWGHAEIDADSMRVVQLLGHSNQELPRDIHDAIMDYLKSMKNFRLDQDELGEQEPF